MKHFTILSLAFCLSSCFSTPEIKTGLEGKPLPSFTLTFVDSLTHFNTANISTGKPIVLFCFAPYCPYCRAEMDDILSNIKYLNNIKFYIFTGSPLSDLKVFYNHFQLQKYSNITAGIDSSNYFAQYYKVTGVPYLAIYNPEKRLKQVLEGKVDIKLIKDIAFK